MRKTANVLHMLTIVTFMLLFNSSGAESATPENAIDSGRNFLLAAQNEDGSWSEPPREFIDTVEVALTLLDIGFEGNLLDDTDDWLYDYPVPQDDYLARKWRFLVHRNIDRSDTFNDLHSSILAHLASLQNTDGGWGTTYRYESDPYGTLLSLETLLEAGYEDVAVMENGISYLLSQQQPDGSWTFTENEGGNLSLSASVIIFLSRYSDNSEFTDQELAAAVTTARQNCAGWIAEFRKGDGGYWMTESNASETALALLALLYNNYSPGFGNNAFTYLLNNQLPNGSWEDDLYATALALRAIQFAKSLANVGISASDITLVNPPALTDTTLTINAKVRNLGGIDLTGVLVDVFDTDPDVPDPATGELPAPISSIGPFDMPVGLTMMTTFLFDAFGKLGPQDFFVVVDRANSIQEIDETNNKASISLPIVLPTPSGLTAKSGDESVTLNWTNLNVPGLDPSLIYGYNIYRDQSTIPVNGMGPIQASPYTDSNLTNDQEYAYQICAMDIYNNESPLSEMVLGVPVAAPAGIDLTAFPGEIFFSPPSGNASITDTVTISAYVRNIGKTGVSGFDVAFYDGYPGEEGVLIQQVAVGALQGESGTNVSIQWVPGSDGTHEIYLVLDPANEIVEADDSNNIIEKLFLANPLPDLSITDADLHPARPLINDLTALVGGQPLYGTAQVNNEGGSAAGQFAVRVTITDASGIEVYRFATNISYLAAGGTGTLKTPSNINLMPGDYTFLVELDTAGVVDEISEDNNSLSGAFHVKTMPDLIVSNIEIIPADFSPGDMVKIRVTIQNLGELNAFYPYDGGFVTMVFDIDDENHVEQIGDNFYLLNLSGIEEGNNSFTFEVNYTVKPGQRYIFVRTDVTKVIGESNGANNEAYLAINKPVLPDLAVFSNSVDMPQETVRAGDDCTVYVTIQNGGAADALNPTVQVYDLDLSSGTETIIDEQTISNIAAGASHSISVTWQPIAGLHQISVVVDPANLITEANETNNMAVINLVVKLQIDLSIEQDAPDDSSFIQFSDAYPRDGETITIAAAFMMSGIEPDEYDDLSVQVYVGNPAFGGTPIGEPITPVIQSANQETGGIANVQWDTTGYTGTQSIFVVVDPANVFEEVNESNNVASKAITVSQPQLMKRLTGFVTITPPLAEQGDEVVLSAIVMNESNAVLQNESIQLAIFPEDGASPVYTNNQTLEELNEGEVALLDFGSFIPSYNGKYEVIITAANPDIETEIGKQTLVIGPFVTGKMTAEPSEAIIGDAPVTVNVELQTLTGSPLQDPFFLRVREAIRRAARWEAAAGPEWQTFQKKVCVGCHVQPQALAGLQVARELVNLGGDPDPELPQQIDDSSAEMLQYMFNCQEPDGSMGCREVYWWNNPTPKRATYHYAWALAHHHDLASVQSEFLSACDYLVTAQDDSSGSWTADYTYSSVGLWVGFDHDWQNDKSVYQGRSCGCGRTIILNPSAYYTATNIETLAKAYEITPNPAYRDGIVRAMDFLTTVEYYPYQLNPLVCGANCPMRHRLISASFVLTGLACGMDFLDPVADADLFNRAVATMEDARNFLKFMQNPNGSWGEWSVQVVLNFNLFGESAIKSKAGDPIPTACAIHALALSGMSALEDQMIIKRGINYLLATQWSAGMWWGTLSQKESYFNPTTWSIIALSEGLKMVQQMDVDVSVTFADSTTVTATSLEPGEIASVEGGTMYTWNFTDMQTEAESFSVDIILNDLQLNESRPVAIEAELSSIHSYTGLQQTQQLDIPTVTGVYPLAVNLSTDKQQYNANETVFITEELSSLGDPIPLVNVKVSIKEQDVVVAEVANVTATDITETPQPLDFTWNTSNRFPGQYKVESTVYDENNTPLLSRSATFEILPDLSVSTNVFTDKVNYNVNEMAVITAKVENQSQNYIFQNLRLTETITNDYGQVGYFEDTTQAVLLDSFVDRQFEWQTATNEPGAYTVTQYVYDGANPEPIATATADFNVVAAPENSVGVTGSITANHRAIYYGQSLIFDCSVTNTGNVAFDNNLQIDIVVKDPSTGAVVHSTSRTISLGLDATYQFTDPYDNITLPTKTYFVSLQGNYEGTVIPIDSTSFEVIDSDEPPFTELLKSEPLYFDGTTYYAKSSCYYSLLATDDLSGVHHTEINLDGVGFTNYENPVRFSSEGLHTIYYFSVDNAQNVEPTKQFSVITDDSPPVTSDGYSGDPCTNVAVALTLTAEDAASGVKTTYYSVDGAPFVEGTAVQISGEGTHSISYYSIDNLDNTESAKERAIDIDTTAPVTTHDYANDGVWVNTDANITLTATDDHCGVQETRYSIDGAPEVAGNLVTITDEGDHVVSYYSIDLAGNIETAKTISVKIDKTAPVSSNDYASDDLCVSADAAITLSATDNLSGVAYTYYSIDGAPEVEGTVVTITAEGDHVITYYSTDVAGNVEAPKTISVVIDKTPPVTTHDYANDGVWVNVDAAITLTATDDHCGVHETRYSIDGAPEVTGNLVSITTEGDHVVSYYSIDLAGNIETAKTISVKIDKTAPVSSNDYASDNLCVSADAAITLSATDNLSEVASTYYSVDGAPEIEGTAVTITDEGDHVITYYSTDVAGNIEAPKTISVVIDKTAPVTTHDYANDGVWVNTDANITLTATDDHCGVHETRYSIDGAPEVAGNLVTITDEGDHVVSYYSIDLAGNIETAKTISVKIDKSPPVTTDDYPSDSVCVNTDATITLSASDTYSGVQATYYSVNGGAFQEGTSFLITAEGTYAVEYYSVDTAGNAEAPLSITVIIDKTPPVTIDDYTHDNVWVNFDAIITLTATDDFCGVAATYHTINGGVWLTANPFTISDEGTFDVLYWSVDVANNSEAANPITVRIDKTAPVTTLTPAIAPIPFEGDLYTVLSNTYALSATDNLSGVERIEYRIDGGAFTTYSSPFSLPSEGLHTISYRAIDIAGNTEAEQSLALIVVVPNVHKELTSEPRVLIWTGEEKVAVPVPTLGPAYVNTSGKHPLDPGMIFEPFTVTNVAKTPAGNKFTVQSLSVNAPFDFSQFTSASVTVRVYNKFGFLVDEETSTCTTIDLPLGAVDANPGYETENLSIDSITASAVTVTFGTAAPQLGDEYHFVVTIENTSPAQNPLFVQDVLSQAGIPYTTVVTRSDFISEFRSGLYNVFILYSEERHAKDTPASLAAEELEAEDRLMKEIREAVFRGDGLIVINSGDEGVGRGHRNDSRLRDAMGGKIKGQFAGIDHTVTLTDSIISTAGLVQAPGRVLVYEPTSAQAVASVNFTDDSTSEIKALSLETFFAFLTGETYQVTASLYSADGTALIDEESISFSGDSLPTATHNEHYGTVTSDIMIDPFTTDHLNLSVVKEGGEKLDAEYQFLVKIMNSAGAIYSVGPTNINTSGVEPLETGMNFGDFKITGLNETATGYLKYRVISLKAPYAFAENDTISLRATAYNMDGVSLVDEETTTFTTDQLPLAAVNYIHGSRNGNLSIDRVTESEVYLTLTVPQEARLASEYVFEIQVNSSLSGETVIGPTHIHTSGSQPIAIGSVFESFTVTSLLEALGAKPAVTMNDYGLGRCVVMMFDVEQSADAMADTSLLSSLILKSTEHVTPLVRPAHTTGEIVQMLITAENDAAIPMTAQLTETAPAGFIVIDAAGGTVVANPDGSISIDWSFDLAGNSDQAVVLVLRAPDAVGDYISVSNLVFDLGDGHLEPIDPVELTLSINAAATSKSNDVVAMLDALNITTEPDISRRALARSLIIAARDRAIASQTDLHENMKDVLKAGDELLKIESVDISSVRTSLGELLRIYEIRYYLFQG